MNRRRFLGMAAAGAGAAALARLGVTADGGKKPPNIIVILADDLGAKELGCYGNTEYKTPNLDALAKGGTMFKTCWATPLCSPTRVGVMTGRYAFRTGWYNLIGRPYSPSPGSKQYDIGKSEMTFAEILKPRGYAIALAGKWQLSGKLPDLIHDCGFDEYCVWAYKNYLPAGVTHEGAWEDAGRTKPARYFHPCIMKNREYVPTKPMDYGPDMHNDFLIDFIKQHKDGPFFVYYTSCLTHAPFDPTPDPALPGGKTAGGFKANLEYLDKLVGTLVKALDDLGIRENTIIIFVGDNGTGGSGKGTVTELGVRVPMIVNCPGTVKAGQVSDELVDFTDVFPTVAEFAGADLPKDRVIDGHSFAWVVRGEQGNAREWIFSYLEDKRLLRDKRWLLEGNGKFFDCGTSRDGKGYKDVTDSKDPEVLAARERFNKILQDLPAADLSKEPWLLKPQAKAAGGGKQGGRKRANQGQ